MRILFFVFIIAIAGCGNIQNNNPASINSTMQNSDSSNPSTSSNKTDFTRDSIITISFPHDSNSIAVKGRINGINKPVTVNIPVSKGQKLMVVLSPEDSFANIRINQVFSPDGKADGPFGRRLDMKIKQPGNYKIIVGENLMQGEEWKGRFGLTVKVE